MKFFLPKLNMKSPIMEGKTTMEGSNEFMPLCKIYAKVRILLGSILRKEKDNIWCG